MNLPKTLSYKEEDTDSSASLAVANQDIPTPSRLDHPSEHYFSAQLISEHLRVVIALYSEV